MAQWVDMEAEKSRTQRMSVLDQPIWGWFAFISILFFEFFSNFWFETVNQETFFGLLFRNMNQELLFFANIWL